MSTVHTLSLEEQDRLLTALVREEPSAKRTNKGLRNLTMALLMLDAGLRVGELVKLLIPDLIVGDIPVTNLIILTEKRKGRSHRTIPVSERLRQALAHMQKLCWSQLEDPGPSYAFYKYSPHCPLTPRQVQRILKSAGQQSIGKDVWPHMLRHTFATRLMATTNIRVVQQLLGHASIQSTQIYTHPNSQDLSNAIKSLSTGDMPQNSQKT